MSPGLRRQVSVAGIRCGLWLQVSSVEFSSGPHGESLAAHLIGPRQTSCIGAMLNKIVLRNFGLGKEGGERGNVPEEQSPPAGRGTTMGPPLSRSRGPFCIARA